MENNVSNNHWVESQGRGVRGKSWSRSEILALLKVWGEAELKHGVSRMRRNYDIFVEMADALRKLGVRRGPSDCRLKAKKLRLDYKRALAHDDTTTGPGKFLYFHEMNRIFCGKPSLLHPDPLPASGSPKEAPAPGRQKAALLAPRRGSPRGDSAPTSRPPPPSSPRRAEDPQPPEEAGPASSSQDPLAGCQEARLKRGTVGPSKGPQKALLAQELLAACKNYADYTTAALNQDRTKVDQLVLRLLGPSSEPQLSEEAKALLASLRKTLSILKCLQDNP